MHVMKNRPVYSKMLVKSFLVLLDKSEICQPSRSLNNLPG